MLCGFLTHVTTAQISLGGRDICREEGWGEKLGSGMLGEAELESGTCTEILSDFIMLQNASTKQILKRLNPLSPGFSTWTHAHGNN